MRLRPLELYKYLLTVYKRTGFLFYVKLTKKPSDIKPTLNVKRTYIRKFYIKRKVSLSTIKEKDNVGSICVQEYKYDPHSKKRKRKSWICLDDKREPFIFKSNDTSDESVNYEDATTGIKDTIFYVFYV